jgi:glycosyltransferase involved in cell wall biosynthesis
MRRKSVLVDAPDTAPAGELQMATARLCGACGSRIPRVVLMISDLEHGGAQRQVVALANGLMLSGVQVDVVSLSDYVPLADGLKDADCRLHVMTRRWKLDASIVWRVGRWLRRHQPDVVHSFLFDAEMIARLTATREGGTVVIGSERNADYPISRWRLGMLRATRGRLDAMIANSHAGRRFQMERFGVAGERVHVVPNGVDTERFAPRPVDEVREQLGLRADTPVVGMFASFKAQKNHPMFFRMARRVRERHPEARFLCVGAELHTAFGGSDAYPEQMRRAMMEMDLDEAVLLLGRQDAVERLYNACDVSVLTSHHEGTPNVVLEAMACGVPVVVTDVADNARIVPEGKAGFLVADDDDAAMARHVDGLLSDTGQRRRMGESARMWVAREFPLSALVARTISVYADAVHRRRSAAGAQPSSSGDYRKGTHCGC